MAASDLEKLRMSAAGRAIAVLTSGGDAQAVLTTLKNKRRPSWNFLNLW